MIQDAGMARREDAETRGKDKTHKFLFHRVSASI